jgi:hypothetical protein
MSLTVEFDPRAELEYFETWLWYESELHGLGDRFGRAVIRYIEIISTAPLAFPSKKVFTREAKIEDFPFLIIYKVFPSKNLIYITSIFHTSRNPRKKYKK